MSNDYILENNINASATTNWSNGSNLGFIPIGTSASPYGGNGSTTGMFNGNNYAISNLYINAPANTANYSGAGLFGTISGATIENVGLINPYVIGAGTTAPAGVGSLVGSGNGGISLIINTYAINATVVGNGTGSSEIAVGGLIGLAYNDIVSNSYTTGAVSSSTSANAYLGGLAGDYALSGSFINSNTAPFTAANLPDYALGFSYSNASVMGANSVYVGGLLGQLHSGVANTINQVYASGTVSGGAAEGGLFGNIRTDTAGTGPGYGITVTGYYGSDATNTNQANFTGSISVASGTYISLRR